MLKKCLVCQGSQIKPPLDHWIEEKHYQNTLNTVKEVFVGETNPPNNATKYNRQYTGSVYYCSWQCFNLQLDQEEQAEWAKGDCVSCQQPIVVVNEQCSDPKHQAKAHYFPLKGKKGGNQ